MRMPEYEGKELFRLCGIPTPDEFLAKNPDEARSAAERLRFPESAEHG